jgi:DNA-binding NarL/FixJ family response regulator
MPVVASEERVVVGRVGTGVIERDLNVGPSTSQTLALVEGIEPETRILVVSDDPLYGEGVKRLLEETAHGRVLCVDSIERAQRFCSADTERCRHIVLWFVDVLDREAFAPARGFQQLLATGLCVVAESVDVDLNEELVRERGGWFGVLLRTQKPNIGLITRTLEQLAEGTASIDCRVLQRLASKDGCHALANLNAMDQRVLELVAAGYRNAEIARRTRRSEKAVEKHVGRLFGKLGLDAQNNGHLDRRVTAAKLFYSVRRIPSLAEA